MLIFLPLFRCPELTFWPIVTNFTISDRFRRVLKKKKYSSRSPFFALIGGSKNWKFTHFSPFKRLCEPSAWEPDQEFFLKFNIIFFNSYLNYKKSLKKVCAKKMQKVFFLLNGVGTANFGLQKMTLLRAGTGQNVMVFSSLNMRKRYEIYVFGT